MDPVHSKALEEVLAQTSTDKVVVPPPPQTTKERPPLQRRPSLDGGAARRAAQDVAAVETTAERIAQERFASPYGKELKKYLRHGIGIHHAGMLPRYRILIERMAQEGYLRLI